MNNTYKEMIEIALSNLDKSYAPYSLFNVSAVVLMSSGKMYSGVNVENLSYSVTICAERNALFHAVACGEREVKAVAIVGGVNGKIDDYCYPCGSCRQALSEFCDPKECDVICAKTPDDYVVYKLEELLPHHPDMEIKK